MMIAGRAVVIVAHLVFVIGCAGPIDCEHGAVDRCVTPDGRFVVAAAPTDSVPLDALRRLAVLALETDTVAWFPTRQLGKQPVDINVIRQQRAGVDATTISGARTVVIGRDASVDWPSSELRRLLRHELTHVATSAVPRHSELPFWFKEGYAEAVAGGLSCAGAIRIQVNVEMNKHLLDEPDLLSDPMIGRSRVGYDLYGTVFEYLELNRPGATATMLDSVVQFGFVDGLRRVAGVDQSDLFAGWRAYVKSRYGSQTESMECDVSARTGVSQS